MPAFNNSSLKKRLKNLDDKQRLTFGALCCERLLPNYLAFQQDSGWGDISPIRESLDFVWACVINRPPGPQKIKNLINSCESAAPNSENFTSLYVTAAQDACFAVCNLLDYLLDKNLDSIVQTATFATDSVDLYVQEIEKISPNDPLLEQKILHHSLMQRELAQEEKDLKIIEQTKSFDQEFINKIKKSWRNNEKSNLDLPAS